MVRFEPAALRLRAYAVTTPPSCVVDLCPLELCWDFYQTAQDSLDFYDDDDDVFPGFSVVDDDDGEEASSSGEAWSERCSILRGFFVCLRNHSRACLGNLNYHSALKGVEKEMRHLNCTVDGPVYRPGTSLHPSHHGPTYRAVCSYRGWAEMRFCAVYGDPHVRSFDGSQETCRVKGAWPLVDNEYLTVQTTHESQVNEEFTAITKVCDGFICI